MKTLAQLLIVIAIISATATAHAESHRLFTALLSDHVHNGWVNYSDLRKDSRLNEYLTQLADTDPAKLTTKNDKLAFWINAYNAYTLKIICDNYPVESINDLHWGGLIIGTVLKKTVWDRDFVLINHTKTTLNAIEHEIIRPLFGEPRAHFALVCASKSCPPLRSEAYEGDHLDEQLDEQAKRFLSDSTKNWYDSRKKEAHISKIFSWFSGDFGKDDIAILNFIGRFLQGELGPALLAHPENWSITYTEYDWHLNGQ
jgi:hypothetical protein